MLRIPARIVAMTIAADAAAFSLTRGDVQWLLVVLGGLVLLVWNFGRRVGATQKTVADTEKAVAKLTERFDKFEEKFDAALTKLERLGTGRRHLPPQSVHHLEARD